MGWEIALSAIGTAVSAIGAIGQGQAQAAQANYQAQVARNNQITANQLANYATAAGEASATDTAMKARAAERSARAALAAGNIDVNTGSAEQVQEGDVEQTQTATERVRANAALRAYGYRAQATDYGAQAGLDTMQAENAQTSGFLKAGGTLFAGAASLAPKWAALMDNSSTGQDYGGP